MPDYPAPPPNPARPTNQQRGSALTRKSRSTSGNHRARPKYFQMTRQSKPHRSPVRRAGWHANRGGAATESRATDKNRAQSGLQSGLTNGCDAHAATTETAAGAPALAEAMRLTQIPRSTIYQMIAQGKIRTVQIGGRHDMPMADVERLCTEGVRTGDDGSPPAIARLVVGLVVGTNPHPDKIINCFNELNDGHGGGRGIRTLDRVAPIHAFQACALSHSATPPLD